MLFAPALAVRSILADMLPVRSLRRQAAIALLAIGCWNSLPYHQQLTAHLDDSVHQLWQMVEDSE